MHVATIIVRTVYELITSILKIVFECLSSISYLVISLILYFGIKFQVSRDTGD